MKQNKNISDKSGYIFYAHSALQSDKSDWQYLRHHLRGVGKLAGCFAKVFKCGEYGKIAGLLHDLGKFTVNFQLRLEGKAPRKDHAVQGAKIALEKYGNLGYLLAYAIAGHHTGLADGSCRDGKKLTPLKERCEKDSLPKLETAWQVEIEPLLPEKLSSPPLKGLSSFQQAFLARMIFSCLVDADRLDTERFAHRSKGLPLLRRGDYPRLQELKISFDASLQAFKADSDINRDRAAILAAVRHNATALEPGLFSLTVPTGGGKTLASMAFALDHAEKFQKRRIIYVIPFTSIIEQNAAVFRTQFGAVHQHAVLEHHSAFNEAEVKNPDSLTKLKMAMENWDAPIIVTTAVQFMESLFSNRTSDCRKLHRIADSVVIFDEVQTLPLPLLRPSLAAIAELERNYGCSIVLCSATQPAFKIEDGFVGGLENVRELAVCEAFNPEKLYQDFQRVTVQHVGKLDDNEVVTRLRNHRQVLCIVNTRNHARQLYQGVPDKHSGIADLSGAYYLTTYMCAAHRKNVLAKIRFALKRGLPCRVVSTSLIECGVDVSFPYVMRSDAGLDSIAQAAGRCNREGEGKKEDSFVHIFTAEHKPPNELAINASKMQETLSRAEFSKDPLGLPAIKDYFIQLYGHHETGEQTQLDKHGILAELQNSKLSSLPFDFVSQKYKIIDNIMETVIVPYDHTAISCIEQLEKLPDGESVSELARKLQSYTVSVPRDIAVQFINKALQYIKKERFGEQFLVLEDLSLYTDELGFNPEADSNYISAEDCCL